LLFISLLKNYTIPVKASPKVIYVPDDYAKIQWAVGNATDGDTIFVRSGTYSENIVIDKSITLIGENRNSTIIDGSETESVIFIKTANNVNVQRFTLKKSGTLLYNSSGVLIERSNGSVISDNTIWANHNGISLFYSSNTVIRANNISKNFYDGVSLYWSTNNRIEDNTVSSNNGGGISLYWSSNNVISANTIVNNSNGMSLAFSSDNNVIYDNNFNNTLQVWSYESTNFWSCDGEGNYWSDYNGTDFYSGPNQDYPGSDGIGDVPYFIDETNVDNSPLMGMFREFGILYKGGIYSVTIVSNSTIFDFQFQIGGETGNKIICFTPMGDESSVGFCRVMVPTRFMSYPYLLLLGNEEISPTFLDASNETHAYLYFTYLHKNQTVTIISSEWYNELLSIYYDLNMTYYNLLNIYGGLLYNYTQLKENFELLNASYQYLCDLNVTFYNFLDDYVRLQEDFHRLNKTYYDLTNLCGKLQYDFDNLSLTYQSLFNTFILLSGNYTQLQEEYQELNASYQDHLRNYSENVSNVKNLTYILATVTAILIIVTTYLSKRAHGGTKIKRFGEE
jgi:parallel beta-helix repeat protein